MKRFFLSFIALLVFTHLAVGGVAADSHVSGDLVVRMARTLMHQGRYAAALRILRPLLKAGEDDTDVRFLVGLAAIEHSRRLPANKQNERVALLEEAIAALRAILIERPGLVRVRLELARAFFLKGEDDLSREHFERVLAGKPPEAVAANVHRFLRTIRARRGWSAYFGFSIAPDTNIGAISNDEVIYIYGLPFRRSEGAEKSSGVGFITWGGAEYQKPLAKRLRLRVGTDFSRREYEERDFDQTVVSVHSGPRWWVSPRSEFSLLANVREHFIGDESYSREIGARLEVEHRFMRRGRLSGRVSWHERQYARLDYLDGPVLSLGLDGSWIFNPTLLGRASFGFLDERPEQLRYRNATYWGRLGFSVALPRGLTLGGSGEFRAVGYEGGWFPFTRGGSSREDNVRIYRLSIYSRAFTLWGFSPQFVVVRESRESNAQLYDYARTRGELRFVRQF